ncbi:GntR family transcriptional regulator [Burkholderia cepacia]|uniref:GntR family transcriptional regulator n=1 Tax=Burkholderia cepacia TaxID=292 RepID=UPI002AB65139|nr:GntR family transcriptional regulator [Burkholderia cepacia]
MHDSQHSLPGSLLVDTVRKKVSRADKAFAQLRDMAIRYELRPGERLSEIELAEKLNVSRTPVREALNRLAQEGFLVPSGRGFSRRKLEVKEIQDLYEARIGVEVECVRLAAQRVTEAQLDEIERFLDESMRIPSGAPVTQLVEFDEAFHRLIASASGNTELVRLLGNLNERIRFIRWIYMEQVGRDNTQAEHRLVLIALRNRDAAACEEAIRSHVAKRSDQIVQAITAGLAKIYLKDAR